MQFKVTDSAGNDGSVTSQTYVLDSTAPVIGIDTLIVGSETPILSGSASEGKLTVTVGGATYQVTPTAGGWHLDLATASPVSGSLSLLPGNTYSVQVVATDAAGNSSTTTSDLKIVIVPPHNAVVPVSDALSQIEPPASTDPTTEPLIPQRSFLSPETEAALNEGFAGASLGSFDNLPSLFPFLGHGVSTNERSSEGQAFLRSLADQFVVPAGYSEITVPADLLPAVDPHAAVQLFARQDNGQALPDWVSFDARTGKFIINAPRNVSGELSIKLVARDVKGLEVSTTFKIRVSTRLATLEPSGRLGLSEQIRLAARHPGAPLAVDQFAKLGRSLSGISA